MKNRLLKIYARFKWRRKKAQSDYMEFPHLWELTFGDKSRFKRLWSIRLNTARLIVCAFLLFCVVSYLGILIVVNTPLKSLLPGYLNTSERHSFEELTYKVDSLSAVNAIQADYLGNLNAILFDSISKVGPEDNLAQTTAVDSVALIPVDSILPTSETERRFAREYERRERHSLAVLSPLAAEGMVFHRPVAAATPTTSGGDNQGSVQSRSVKLSSTASAPVSTVYGGTVIATYNEPGEGIAVIVQHPREFVSIYRGLASVYVKPGDKLTSGARIGALPTRHPSLNFSLWRNGIALDPASYIPF